MKLSKFISELKRRHVFKSTIAYLAISWVVIQIASVLLPALDATGYCPQGLDLYFGGRARFLDWFFLVL